MDRQELERRAAAEDRTPSGYVLARVQLLPAREWRVLTMFHLPPEGEAPADLSTIGGELGLARARVREVLGEAQDRLRDLIAEDGVTGYPLPDRWAGRDIEGDLLMHRLVGQGSQDREDSPRG